jgi:hypothetical protein
MLTAGAWVLRCPGVDPEEESMHAVFVTVKVEDVEAAKANLRDEVVPRVKQVPGFVAGYWLAPEGDRGNSVVVFETEEAARSAAESLQPPPQVTLETIEVREVIAHA